jgi:hypothetical protein
MTILNDDHTEPFICISDRKSGEILSQTFNFLDYLGGKQAIQFESKCSALTDLDVEKYLVMRGVIPASNSTTIKNQKDKEAMQFIIESSHVAGDAY